MSQALLSVVKPCSLVPSPGRQSRLDNGEGGQPDGAVSTVHGTKRVTCLYVCTSYILAEQALANVFISHLSARGDHIISFSNSRKRPTSLTEVRSWRVIKKEKSQRAANATVPALVLAFTPSPPVIPTKFSPCVSARGKPRPLGVPSGPWLSRYDVPDPHWLHTYSVRLRCLASNDLAGFEVSSDLWKLAMC